MQLRLVGNEDPDLVAGWARDRTARAAIAADNVAAVAGERPDLDATDPRWVLAVRTHAALQGSTLTPERRDRVMRTARRLGVRPFDANLVIAIVQDAARRGQPLGSSLGTLAMVPEVDRSRPRMHEALRLGAAIGAAIVLTALAIRWIS